MSMVTGSIKKGFLFIAVMLILALPSATVQANKDKNCAPRWWKIQVGLATSLGLLTLAALMTKMYDEELRDFIEYGSLPSRIIPHRWTSYPAQFRSGELFKPKPKRQVVSYPR